MVERSGLRIFFCPNGSEAFNSCGFDYDQNEVDERVLICYENLKAMAARGELGN